MAGVVTTGAGLALIAASFSQLLAPDHIFEPPMDRVLGLPLIPVSVLGFATTLLTLGVILAAEGICLRLGAPSLGRLVIADPWKLLYIFPAGALAGVTMEVLGQWLGKLWVYPYWTTWFYALLLVPGFAFYWLSIAESYLAVKAVLDSLTARRSRSGPRGAGFAAVLGVVGIASLLASLFLFLHWYAHSGFSFAITTASATAPPFAYALLALIGVVSVTQWVLYRQRRASPLDGIRHGYWTPIVAVAVASVILSLVMETLNAVHHHWLYTHFPAPEVAFGGVPLSVLAAWPLQYLVFLLIPSLVRAELADLFWRRPAHEGQIRDMARG